MKIHNEQLIREPSYFSNWGDILLPRIAILFLPFVKKIAWLTPNYITIASFFIYTLGSSLFFFTIPYHRLLAAILLPTAYILDCLDGQVARSKNMGTQLGDYLDKTLDVLKIFIITFSLALAAYIQTQQVQYIFLGFITCFFFNYRYYIKLETMFSEINRDKDYLIKSKIKRIALYDNIASRYKSKRKSLFETIRVFLHINRAFVFVDEAEFVIFSSIAAVFNKFEFVLWVFVVSQTCIAIFRFFERGFQLHRHSEKLLWPMRK